MLRLIFIACLLLPFNLKTNSSFRVTHLLTFQGQVREHGQQYILVKSTLLNNTDDTLRFVTMQCSYTDGFTVSSKQLSIETPMCYKNSWCYEKIAPYKQFSRSLKLLVKSGRLTDSEKLDRSNFKLGFNFIEQESPLVQTRLSEIDKVTNMKNVIWSNTIDMSDTSYLTKR